MFIICPKHNLKFICYEVKKKMSYRKDHWVCPQCLADWKAKIKLEIERGKQSLSNRIKGL